MLANMGNYLAHAWPIYAGIVGLCLVALGASIFLGPLFDTDGRIVEATCHHYWRKRQWWTQWRGRPGPHAQFACDPCRQLWMRHRDKF